MDENGDLSRDPSYDGTGAPAQHVLDRFNERRRSRAPKAKVMLQWTEHFVHVIDRIQAGDSTDPDALRVVFWVRLHGLAVDFSKEHAAALALLDGEPPPGSILAVLENVTRTLNATLGALTEDELLYAEYRRHVDAHLWQNAYDVQLPPKSKQVNETCDNKYSKYTRKSYDVRDRTARIAGVVRRYGTEAAIADDFARRLAPHARQLLAAMQRFCSQT